VLADRLKNYDFVISGKKLSIASSELFSLLTCRYRVVPIIQVRGLYLYIYRHSRLVLKHLFLRFLVNDQLDAQIVLIQLLVTVTPFWWQCRVLVGSTLTNYINTSSGNCHSVLVAVSCVGWE
jgi:hypothetical protein